MARSSLPCILICLAITVVLGAATGTAAPPRARCAENPVVGGLSKGCKFLIVGGGAGGLLTAFLLKDLGKQLCVVEKEEVWGGRIQDDVSPTNTDPESPTKVFGTCGLRITRRQVDMRCVANELGVQLEESAFEDRFYSRGQWTLSMQTLVGNRYALTPATTASQTALFTALLNFAIMNDTNIHPLTGKAVEPHPITRCAEYPTVGQYLLEAVGAEAFEFMNVANSFRGRYAFGMDVCAFIRHSQEDRQWGSDNFYIRGGWGGLLSKLRKKTADAGVKFISNREVKCLYRLRNGDYAVTRDTNGRRGWVAQRLVLNTAPYFLKQMGGSLGNALNDAPEIVHSVNQEGVVVNAFWPRRFWEEKGGAAGGRFGSATIRPGTAYKNSRVILSEGGCFSKMEFPAHPDSLSMNASRIVYTEEPKCVALLKSVYAQGGLAAVEELVLRDLQNIFNGIQVPKPTLSTWYNKPTAWNWLGPYAAKNGVTVDSLVDFASKPLGKPNLCLVGDSFDRYGAAWVAGAASTVYDCLMRQFPTVVPGLAARIQYYRTGCGGTITQAGLASNEASPNATLPLDQRPPISSFQRRRMAAA